MQKQYKFVLKWAAGIAVLLAIGIASLLVLIARNGISDTRFEAEYVASKSQITAYVSSVVVRRDPDESKLPTSYALIQICPKDGQAGAPFRLEAFCSEEKGIWLRTPAGIEKWSWATVDPLRMSLDRMGYRGIEERELARFNHALANSLSGSRGFFLEGQGREIDVVKAKIGMVVIKRSLPLEKWVDPTTLPSCAAGERYRL